MYLSIIYLLFMYVSIYKERDKVFVLVRPPTDWVRPVHIMEGNLFHSVPTGSCVYMYICMYTHTHTRTLLVLFFWIILN